MIQELFGGGSAGLINRERKISLPGVFEPSLVSPSLSPSPSPSSSSSSATTTTTAAVANPTTSSTNNSENQNLRCPRCDSSNTKFCYYNNYNLTQPRHFCKTCRRYWTKGGALRNVPIGGGCRKNKGGGTTIAAAVGVGKPISANGKLKAVVSTEIGKSGFINGFDHDFPANPILWAGPGPSQTSHLISLLRATQNPNPNPNPNFPSNANPVGHVKDDSFMIGSYMANLGFDPQGQTSSLGLCSSLWRNNQMTEAQAQQNGGIMMGHEGQNSGQLYQRLRSSPANFYQPDHQPTPPLLLGNVANTSSSATSTSSTILESSPVVAGAELGFWNPTLPWSDLPTTANGAYP